MDNKIYKILVVDDETDIAVLLVALLSAAGFITSCALNGEMALNIFNTNSFDLILLDLVLPGITGLEICKIIRRKSQIPIIMLTGRSDNNTQLECLQNGADDYVTKPFINEILLARIKRLLDLFHNNGTEQKIPDLRFNDGYIEFDFIGGVISVAGIPLKLTAIEFKILKTLVGDNGKLVDYERLVTKVWGQYSEYYRHNLQVHVNNLRKKIEPNFHEPRYILNSPQFGYRFGGENLIK